MSHDEVLETVTTKRVEIFRSYNEEMILSGLIEEGQREATHKLDGQLERMDVGSGLGEMTLRQKSHDDDDDGDVDDGCGGGGGDDDVLSKKEDILSFRPHFDSTVEHGWKKKRLYFEMFTSYFSHQEVLFDDSG